MSAALLTCMCSPLVFSAASDASTGEALDQDTAVEGVTAVDCDAVVDTFLTRRSKMPKLTPESHNHMLYFLHIPRTAGRTYHACFLKCALSRQPANTFTAVSLRLTSLFSSLAPNCAADLLCRLSHPPSKRCAKSYDVLRLDISVPACGLLSSHDDFSVVDNLPEDAAVITQVRLLCPSCHHSSTVLQCHLVHSPPSPNLDEPGVLFSEPCAGRRPGQ